MPKYFVHSPGYILCLLYFESPVYLRIAIFGDLFERVQTAATFEEVVGQGTETIQFAGTAQVARVVDFLFGTLEGAEAAIFAQALGF